MQGTQHVPSGRARTAGEETLTVLETATMIHMAAGHCRRHFTGSCSGRVPCHVLVKHFYKRLVVEHAAAILSVILLAGHTGLYLLE